MAKKINLMISIDGLHHGGAERVVAALCNNLDKDRFSVVVCWRSACGAIGEELLEQGHEVIGIPELQPDVTPYRRFLVLKKLMKDRKIDILHTHDTGALADGAQCRLLGSRTKLIHTFHFGNYPNLKKRYILLETIFSRFANKLIAVGYEQGIKIRKTLHLSASRLGMIYNGVEQQKVSSDTSLVASYRNLPNKPVIVGSISTLTEQKGLSYLLDTVKILQSRKVNCIFLIAGDGPLRKGLEEKCKALGITDMVVFLGWVPNAAAHLLSSIDIFCQSSLWEANSIVLLEAMAAGRPIVTTDVGESRHVIDPGRNGMIVMPRNVEAMANAIEDLVKDSDRCQVMGDQAQQDFYAKYTVDKMIASYSEVYESLL